MNQSLEQQIAKEREEILNAAPIVYGPSIPTCHLCGRILKPEEAKRIEVIAGNERFAGACCV